MFFCEIYLFLLAYFNENDRESSVSSNFSMFQPNEELKSFYQNEFWNNQSSKKGKKAQRDEFSSDDEGKESDYFENNPFNV